MQNKVLRKCFVFYANFEVFKKLHRFRPRTKTLSSGQVIRMVCSNSSVIDSAWCLDSKATELQKKIERMRKQNKTKNNGWPVF